MAHKKKSCLYLRTFPYVHSFPWSDRITTCFFFKTTYLILVNLQAVKAVRSVASDSNFYQLPPDKEDTAGLQANLKMKLTSLLFFFVMRCNLCVIICWSSSPWISSHIGGTDFGASVVFHQENVTISILDEACRFWSWWCVIATENYGNWNRREPKKIDLKFHRIEKTQVKSSWV